MSSLEFSRRRGRHCVTLFKVARAWDLIFIERRGLSCSCQGLSVKGDRVKIERRETLLDRRVREKNTQLFQTTLSSIFHIKLHSVPNSSQFCSQQLNESKERETSRESKNQSNVKNSSGSCFESWPISSQSRPNRDPREVILNPPRSVESAYLLKVNTRSVLKFHPRQNRIPERRSGAGGERGKKGGGKKEREGRGKKWTHRWRERDGDSSLRPRGSGILG